VLTDVVVGTCPQLPLRNHWRRRCFSTDGGPNTDPTAARCPSQSSSMTDRRRAVTRTMRQCDRCQHYRRTSRPWLDRGQGYGRSVRHRRGLQQDRPERHEPALHLQMGKAGWSGRCRPSLWLQCPRVGCAVPLSTRQARRHPTHVSECKRRTHRLAL